MFKLDAIQLRKVKMLVIAAIIPCIIGASLWTLRYRRDYEAQTRSLDSQFLQMLRTYLDDTVFTGGVEAVNRAGLLAKSSGLKRAENGLAEIVNSNPLVDAAFIMYSERVLLQYPATGVSIDDIRSLPWYVSGQDAGLRFQRSMGDALAAVPSIYFTKSMTLVNGERVLIGVLISTEMVRTVASNYANWAVPFGLVDISGEWLVDGFYDAELSQLVRVTQPVPDQIRTARTNYSFYRLPSTRYPYEILYASPNLASPKLFLYEGTFVFLGLMAVMVLLSLVYVIISRNSDIAQAEFSNVLDRYFVDSGELINQNNCKGISVPPYRELIPSLANFRDLIVNRMTDARLHREGLELKVREMQAYTADLESHLETQKQRAMDQKRYINYLAFNDVLTKLPNRRYLRDRLNEILRSGSSGVIVMFDIDNFNTINDSKGHSYGDKVLMEVAKRISVLEGDQIIVSRYGADEFVVLYYNEADRDRLRNFVSIITHTFDEPIKIERDLVDIKMSMGIALFPQDAETADDLLSCANMAMHHVKDSSKNGHKYFDQRMLEKMTRTQNILDTLKAAIETDGYHVVYQPQIDTKTGELHGFEALLRLNGNEYLPNEFIPVAELSGLIVPLGRIVTEAVIRQIASWKREYGHAKPVSINFSVKQMLDPEYQDFLFTQLRHYRVEPSLIELEITENVFLDNRDQTIALLKKFRDAGIQIAIDDFGTGYSSLSYLTFVPLDKVKFDRSLLTRYLNFENEAVIDSLVSLAHSLGLRVVSEGVETQMQFDRIRHHGCDYVQGYYFSVPLAPEQAARYLMQPASLGQEKSSNLEMVRASNE